MTITRSLPFADYLARDSEHFSVLKAIDISPLHYLRARDHGRKDTDALRIGRATHGLLLTPTIADVAIWANGRRAGKEWAAFKAEAAGRTIITEAEAEAADGMRAAIQANPIARTLLTDGDPEVTIEWTDARTGLPCRARADFLGDDVSRHLVEVKTARSSHPRAFASACARLLYHAQLAFYCDGYETETGEPPASVHVIVVEKDPPHDVCVYRVGQEVLDAGRRKIDAWLARVAECRAAGTWPGAGGDGVVDLVLPDYAMTDGLEDVDMDGIGGANADGEV
jgi:hypothetical protein